MHRPQFLARARVQHRHFLVVPAAHHVGAVRADRCRKDHTFMMHRPQVLARARVQHGHLIVAALHQFIYIGGDNKWAPSRAERRRRDHAFTVASTFLPVRVRAFSMDILVVVVAHHVGAVRANRQCVDRIFTLHHPQFLARARVQHGNLVVVAAHHVGAVRITTSSRPTRHAAPSTIPRLYARSAWSPCCTIRRTPRGGRRAIEVDLIEPSLHRPQFLACMRVQHGQLIVIAAAHTREAVQLIDVV